MAVSARTNRTLARTIDRYLDARGSPLAGQGQKLVSYGQRYGVDPRLVVAIAGAETSFGTDPNAGDDPDHFNLWGYGPHIQFRSWDHAFRTIMPDIRKHYLDKGLTTPLTIGKTWVGVGGGDIDQWAQTVQGISDQLGGKGGDYAPGGRDPVSSWKPTVPDLEPLTPPEQSSLAQGDASTVSFDPVQRALGSLSDIASGHYDPSAELAQTTQQLLTDQMRARTQEQAAAIPEVPNIGEVPTLPSDTQTSDTQEGVTQGGPMAPAPDNYFGNIPDKTVNDPNYEADAPQLMLEAIQMATKMGLHAGENPYSDHVDPVHVGDSFHYQDYKGKYDGKTLGRALDVSAPGDPNAAEKMARFADWAYRRFGKRLTQLFYDPAGGVRGSIRYGEPLGHTIGGHSDHVHIAF